MEKFLKLSILLSKILFEILRLTIEAIFQAIVILSIKKIRKKLNLRLKTIVMQQTHII